MKKIYKDNKSRDNNYRLSTQCFLLGLYLQLLILHSVFLLFFVRKFIQPIAQINKDHPSRQSTLKSTGKQLLTYLTFTKVKMALAKCSGTLFFLLCDNLHSSM